MKKITLSDEQIIDLIFEKKINFENISISAKHSYLGILSKLDERLRYGKILRCKDPIFCEPSQSADHGDRIGLITAGIDSH